MIVARALFVLLLLCASEAEDKNKHNVTTLRLIVVVPLTTPTAPAQWERGPEILPGARLAVDEINRMAVLSGYELELAVVDEAGCHPDTSVLSFYEQVAVDLGRQSSQTIGVVGLMCSAVSKAMQALCGVPGGVNLVQLSAGPSSVRASEEAEGSMAHGMIADSAAYASMNAALLDELGVTGFGVLYSGRSDAYSYYLPTAEALGRQIDATGKTLTYMRQVEITDASETVADLQAGGAVTAVYTSLDVATTALVLCAAGRINLVWPNFAWLVLDHEASELYAANQCSTVELAKGLEGAILVRRNLEPVELNREMVAGGAYREYLEALEKYSHPIGADTFRNNPYANVLYDAVWSMALALNNSLQNHPGLGSGEDETVGKWVEKGLPSVSFNGAHDFVDFNKNKSTIDHSIRINQVISGKPKLLGYYFTMQNRMEIINPLGQQRNISKFRAVQPRYILIPTVVAVVVLTLTGIVALLTTVILILLLYYRTESEIKATSPKISIFMFIGCYLLCAAIGLEVIFRIIVVEGKATKVACNVTVWPASIGLNLILTTLLVRLARVYYLFSSIRVLQKERELWTDRTLFCVVLLVVLGNVVLLTTWAVVDNYHVEDGIVTSTSATKHSSVRQYCKSKYLMLWLPLICLYSLVIIGAIIVLTTLTRKIKRRHFKDTKKVNAFIFMLFVTCSIMIPLWWVSKFVNYTLSGVMLCLCYGTTAVLCQLLLFVPKTIPPFIRDVFKTKLMEEQLASSTDSERKRPSLLRKMSSTAI